MTLRGRAPRVEQRGRRTTTEVMLAQKSALEGDGHCCDALRCWGGRGECPSAATAILFVLNGQAVVQRFTRSSHGKAKGSDPTGAGGFSMCSLHTPPASVGALRATNILFCSLSCILSSTPSLSIILYLCRSSLEMIPNYNHNKSSFLHTQWLNP